MHMHDLHARVDFEQRAQIVSLLESLAVTLFAVVTAAILPQLILQYLLRDGNLPESQPFFLQYLPHMAYGLAALWFLMAFVQNFARSRRIRQYREEIAILEITGEDCDCGDHHDHEEEMALEMDGMEDETMEPMPEPAVEPVKTSRRKKTVASKKSTKTRSSKK